MRRLLGPWKRLPGAAAAAGGRGSSGGPGAGSLFFQNFYPFCGAMKSPPVQAVHRNRNNGAQQWLKRKSPSRLQVRVERQLPV